MSRYWRNNSGNSSGTSYYNVNNNKQADSSEFMSFNDSPQNWKFSPNNYSSPQKYNRPPRNFPYKRSKNWSNRSHNSSFNSSYSNTSNSDLEGPNRIHHYIHPSFLEDPWADLEAQLKQKQTEES